MPGFRLIDRRGTGVAPAFTIATPALAVALALVLLAGAGRGAPPTSASWPSSSLEWNNGWVLCNFDPTSPSVAVSALSLSDSGLSSGISSIAEVNATGATVAVASMAAATWAVWNASTEDTFDLAYAAQVPLVAASGSPSPLGSADVRVDYALAAYGGSAGDNLSSVAAEFQVSNWTWQGPADRLVMTLPIWPTFPDVEHLTSPATNSLEITSSSNATGSPREYFLLADSATATPVNGAPESVGVTPQVSLSSSFASVALTVGSGAGAYASLTYTAHVSIPLPSTVVGVPLYDYVLVGGAAAVLSVAVALGTRRVRQRPSDLQYVEEGP